MIVSVGGASNRWHPVVVGSLLFSPVPAALALRLEIPLYVPSNAVVVLAAEPATRAAPGSAPSQCPLRVPCGEVGCCCGVHATIANSAMYARNRPFIVYLRFASMTKSPMPYSALRGEGATGLAWWRRVLCRLASTNRTRTANGCSRRGLRGFRGRPVPRHSPRLIVFLEISKC